MPSIRSIIFVSFIILGCINSILAESKKLISIGTETKNLTELVYSLSKVFLVLSIVVSISMFVQCADIIYTVLQWWREKQEAEIRKFKAQSKKANRTASKKKVSSKSGSSKRSSKKIASSTKKSGKGTKSSSSKKSIKGIKLLPKAKPTNKSSALLHDVNGRADRHPPSSSRSALVIIE